VSARLARLVRPVAAVTLVVCFARLSAVATQQPGQLPKPSFTSSVDIVSVDVNVIDRNGRPVRDLAAGDFTLTVDGRPRKIASAQFVSVTAPAIVPEPPPADYSTNVGAAAGRLIVIVVDRGNIAPVRSKDVLAAAAKFVSRLGPLDRVALFSIPSGAAVDFTTDRDAVTSALQRMDGQADPGPNTKNVGIAEAMQIESGSTLAFDELVARECGSMIAIGPGTTGGSELMQCRRRGRLRDARAIARCGKKGSAPSRASAAARCSASSRIRFCL
jgi:VWFA-related protein